MSEKYFYVQDSRSYVGNDVLWWALGGGYTTNLLKAEVFTFDRAKSLHLSRNTDIPWLKSYIDDKTRPTVDMQYIRRVDGLKGTDLKIIKPKKQRPTTGKTRGNCPVCGKITWDYNPHENAYCSVHNNPLDRV